jgi:predicted alpha/beta hydrolase family esterase
VHRRFLVLHGLGNCRPRAHWQWWLVDRLRTHGEQVLYPQLPDPDAPDLTSWLDLLAGEYDQLGDGERIVICHSLACALWYQASERGLVDPIADRVLLVEPPGPSVLAEAATAAFAPREWSTDVLHSSSRAPIRLVASDIDPYCPEGPAAVVYGQPLGIDADTIPGAGHLTPSDGYGPWPDVLSWCLDPETTVDFDAARSLALHEEPTGKEEL